MTKIEVFDPALCCSAGVCGVDVDGQLVAFAADVQWANGQGATIARYNLASQPQEFAEHPAVADALAESGQDSLPVTVVDGQAVLRGRYPTRDELAGWCQLSPADQSGPQLLTVVDGSCGCGDGNCC